LQEAFGIRDESAFKAASGLHGGMGKGDVCGSLMGSILMIGLICGKSIAESGQPKGQVDHSKGPPPVEISAKLTGDLYDWFAKEFGSVKCNDIRSTHEKQVDVELNASDFPIENKMQMVHAKCDLLCGKTAAKTVEILWDIFTQPGH